MSQDRTDADARLVGQTLRGLRFFRDLTDEQLGAVARGVRYSRRGARSQDKPDFPTEQDEPREHLFVLLSGAVSLYGTAQTLPPQTHSPIVSQPLSGGSGGRPGDAAAPGSPGTPTTARGAAAGAEEPSARRVSLSGRRFSGAEPSAAGARRGARVSAGGGALLLGPQRKPIALLGPGDAFGEEAVRRRGRVHDLIPQLR